MAAALTSSAMQLFLKVGFALIACVILAGLFFAAKYGMKWRQRKKAFKIKAIIHNPDGTWFTDVIGKFKDKDDIDKMLFLEMKESMPVIDPKYIIANSVELWRYAPGQYAVIPPRTWGRNPKDFKIEIINMQAKNFAFLEQRAAVSRWAFIKDAMQRWAPYITVLLILVLGGVAIWLISKMAYSMFGEATAARLAECTKMFGGGSVVAPPA